MSSDCLFCKILNKEIPGDIVFENDELLAFNDISPQAPTHVLIIPKIHIATVNDLTEAESGLIGRMILCAKTLAAENGFAESGYRLVLNCNAEGGQTVFHIHLHLMGGRQLRGLG
ncbi:MAG: histidine triad nucleotide-binding protein [Gammaproteobacteria bacterium]|nr:histidine triad nucleotide-binding protein [Gammaproteobacteria bacterium]